MKRWNATMPREAPNGGNAHVVIAYKKASGMRAEFEGQLCFQDAEKLLQMAIEMMKNAKEKA